RLGTADRVSEGRAQRVDGGVHDERNWWTELPNGSEISSISSGGIRSPLASSGCSSRRAGRASDSPLIFLCSISTPYSSPSGRGGHEVGGAAGGAERHRPQRVGLGPVDQLIELRNEPVRAAADLLGDSFHDCNTVEEIR